MKDVNYRKLKREITVKEDTLYRLGKSIKPAKLFLTLVELYLPGR